MHSQFDYGPIWSENGTGDPAINKFDSTGQLWENSPGNGVEISIV